MTSGLKQKKGAAIDATPFYLYNDSLTGGRALLVQEYELVIEHIQLDFTVAVYFAGQYLFT
jgi:hypothetical protein